MVRRRQSPAVPASYDVHRVEVDVEVAVVGEEGRRKRKEEGGSRREEGWTLQGVIQCRV